LRSSGKTLAIKEIIVPESLRKDLLKLPANVRELFYKKLDLYLKNPSHRSLRVHSLKSRPKIKSLSITRHYRATFYIEGQKLVIEAVGGHEIYR